MDKRPSYSLFCLVLCLILAACDEAIDPVASFKAGHYEKSFAEFKKLADAGDLDAVNYLGVHYYMGAGVRRNFRTAAEWYEIAALAGHPGAQKNLGVMYYHGLGVKQNYHRAFGWMYQALSGGNMRAQKYINLMRDNVTPNASGLAVRIINKQIAMREKLLDTTQ